MRFNSKTWLNILLSLALAGAILYWMYRDFSFAAMRDVLLHKMNWWWMLLSLPFGILAQMFRGWRWKQTLRPLDYKPRTIVAVCAIFISYAVSLLVPRIGEFVRCGVLRQKDKVPFVKALGTVVTERVIDSLLLVILLALIVLSQFTVFSRFFFRTGFNIPSILQSFTLQGYIVTAVCIIIAAIFICLLLRRMTFYDRLRSIIRSLVEGITSLRHVSNIPLFIIFTLAIWLSYFLHYYLTFFCFASTAHLGIICALATFAVGTVAVVVPTPNGAGPWHFAVKTMLILYGVADNDALYFVFIVHALQTAFVALLGVYGYLRISFVHSAPSLPENE